jgi:hypothetical protein
MDTLTICNMALLKLGVPALTTLDEPNSNARMCRVFFPALRDRCLRDHAWSFAMASAPLSVLEEASPDPDYPLACTVPADALRLVRMSDGSPFRRMGERLLAQSRDASVEYVRRVEDPEVFDPLFVEALVFLLASELCMAVTRDAAIGAQFRQGYLERLAVARSIDSQENVAAIQRRRAPRSSWIEARRRGV